jgi:uncharacterized peroxidase-related enzyme
MGYTTPQTMQTAPWRVFSVTNNKNAKFSASLLVIPLLVPCIASRSRSDQECKADKRGKLADVHKIQSLNPDSITAHMDLYMTVMFGSSPLSRARREMMAVVVSSVNRCSYCVRHHGAALNYYWKDETKIKALGLDYTALELNDQDKSLCVYANQLTCNPDKNMDDQMHLFRKHGLDDRAILDATLVIAYFNFVNRVILGLGVEIEADGGKGYSY